MPKRLTVRALQIALATALLCAIGCGHNQESDSSGSRHSGPVLTLNPATVGEIEGTVTLLGAPPEPKQIDMGAAPPCLKLNTTRTAPVVTTGVRGELANVVVYVKDGLGNYQFDSPKDPVMVDQKDCMFAPRVVALMTGQPIEVQNSDPLVHNVHTAVKHNRGWNHSQPVGGVPITQSFARPEFASFLQCNIHPWMRSYLFVFDHPYFQVTTTEGAFDLKKLPPGTYTIEAWHERLGTQDQTVTVGPHESKAISFAFKSGN